MGIKGGHEQTNTDVDQTNTADPFVQAQVQRGMDQYWRSMGGMPSGDNVADMNQMQTDAYNAMNQRGMQGSAQEQAFDNYLSGQLGADRTGQLSGASTGMLGAAGLGAGALAQQASGQINPMVSSMFRQGAADLAENFNESVMPGINATFGAAGRTGSGLHADAVGNAAGELADAQASMATNLYGNAAEQAMQRQLQAGGQLFGQGGQMGMGGLGQLAQLQQGAAGMTGMASELDYNNLDRAAQAGGAFQDQAQAELDGGISNWQRQMQGLGMMPGMLNPMQGTGRTVGDNDTYGNSVGKGKQ